MNFEIGGPAGNSRRYRRPYVAVWIEDKGGLTVRTLELWLQTRQPGPRWHKDLKRWYRDDQVRRQADETNLIDTISRATRPPGKYTVTWDGKDDHGKPVGPGTYHGLHRGRTRARDVPAHPQGSHHRRQAVRRGSQGQCRDQVRIDRVSPKGNGSSSLEPGRRRFQAKSRPHRRGRSPGSRGDESSSPFLHHERVSVGRIDNESYCDCNRHTDRGGRPGSFRPGAAAPAAGAGRRVEPAAPGVRHRS